MKLLCLAITLGLACNNFQTIEGRVSEKYETSNLGSKQYNLVISRGEQKDTFLFINPIDDICLGDSVKIFTQKSESSTYFGGKIIKNYGAKNENPYN